MSKVEPWKYDLLEVKKIKCFDGMSVIRSVNC